MASTVYNTVVLDSGEDPLSGAQRELLEETGYAAATWRLLGRYAVAGNQGCGSVHVFEARDARKTQDPAAGDLEDIEVLLMTRTEIIQALRHGDVAILPSAAAFLLGLLYTE